MGAVSFAGFPIEFVSIDTAGFAALCQSGRNGDFYTGLQYIGWVESKDSYAYFAAADLVVFPGRHSVFWEQVAAQGIPMLVKSWDGTHHVDLGGNVRFLYEDSVAEIQGELERLLEDPERLAQMKRVAVEKGMRTFSYNDISQRAIAH